MTRYYLDMSFTRLHLLTERLSSLMRADLRQVAAARGLKLVQLEVLIYLSVANRYSDTPRALTEYFAVTKGTMSQTLKALERHGFIDKWTDADDARIQHCALTAEGRSIAAAAYPAACFTALDQDAASTFADSLAQQLQVLQRAIGLRTFGLCHTCRFFERRARGGRCGVTGEALTKSDASKICREHELPL